MKDNELTIFKQFYRMYKKVITINEFENWLYDEPFVEDVIGKDIYFDLISLNYKSKFIDIELQRIIYNHIPFSEIECYRFKDNLKSVIYGEGDLVELLEGFYDDYCDGYSFFRFIGMSYVMLGFENMLRIRDVADVNAPSFIENRKGYIKYERYLKDEAVRLLGFLDDGLIKIIAEFEYEDYRLDTDKVEINNIEHLFNQLK